MGIRVVVLGSGSAGNATCVEGGGARVPHDAVDTVGYALECEGTRFGYATDLGHDPEPVRRALADCDLLMLESNHDADMLRTGPYPMVVKERVRGRHGHLDNDTAAALLGD